MLTLDARLIITTVPPHAHEIAAVLSVSLSTTCRDKGAPCGIFVAPAGVPTSQLILMPTVWVCVACIVHLFHCACLFRVVCVSVLVPPCAPESRFFSHYLC